jgi:hypothetical protein
VTAEREQFMPRQNCLEPSFAFKKRETPQILFIEKHQIEGAVL